MPLKQNAVRIFVSYAHKDFHHRESLEANLAAFRYSGKATIWHDGRIEPGQEWDPAIAEELSKSDIVIVLITSHFFNSVYCVERELTRAREREKEGLCDLVPVLVEPCDYEAHWIGKLQMLPIIRSVVRSVVEFRPTSKGWTKVAEGIRKKIEMLTENRPVMQTIDGRDETIHSGQVAVEVGEQQTEHREFENVSEFWRAQAGLEKIAVATIQGTLSRFAPLVMGAPNAKRRLHKEFRQVIETNRKFGKQKSLTIDTCISVSSGQMVARETLDGKPKLLLGLYGSIVRNSIPVFVQRDYYEKTVRPMFQKSGDKECFEARVTGRVFQLDNNFIRRFLVRQQLTKILLKKNIDDLCENAFALEVGEEGTGIYARTEAVHYLDGDIWVAIRKPDGSERFLTSFVDLTNAQERSAELQTVTN